MARPPNPASIWDASSSPSSSSSAAAPLPRLLPPPRPRPLPLEPFPPRPPLLLEALELPALALLALVPPLPASLSLPPSPLAAAAALAVVPWSAANGQHSRGYHRQHYGWSRSNSIQDSSNHPWITGMPYSMCCLVCPLVHTTACPEHNRCSAKHIYPQTPKQRALVPSWSHSCCSLPSCSPYAPLPTHLVHWWRPWSFSRSSHHRSATTPP
jgi:hypothetical protein